MRTLTHEPLAFVFAAVLIIAIVAGLTVWVTLLISKLRTDRVASATGAAGPDAPRAEASGPGRTRPQGGGRSAGYARSAEASGTSPGAADTGVEQVAATLGSTAPEGAPAALSGATDPIAQRIDTAAALLAQDKDLERHEAEFSRDVERWLLAANAYCVNCGTPIQDCHYGAERPLWVHVVSMFVGCPDGGLFAAPRPPVVPGRSES